MRPARDSSRAAATKPAGKIAGKRAPRVRRWKVGSPLRISGIPRRHWVSCSVPSTWVGQATFDIVNTSRRRVTVALTTGALRSTSACGSPETLSSTPLKAIKMKVVRGRARLRAGKLVVAPKAKIRVALQFKSVEIGHSSCVRLDIQAVFRHGGRDQLAAAQLQTGRWSF